MPDWIFFLGKITASFLSLRQFKRQDLKIYLLGCQIVGLRELPYLKVNLCMTLCRLLEIVIVSIHVRTFSSYYHRQTSKRSKVVVLFSYR